MANLTCICTIERNSRGSPKIFRDGLIPKWRSLLCMVKAYFLAGDILVISGL